VQGSGLRDASSALSASIIPSLFACASPFIATKQPPAPTPSHLTPSPSPPKTIHQPIPQTPPQHPPPRPRPPPPASSRSSRPTWRATGHSAPTSSSCARRWRRWRRPSPCLGCRGWGWKLAWRAGGLACLGCVKFCARTSWCCFHCCFGGGAQI